MRCPGLPTQHTHTPNFLSVCVCACCVCASFVCPRCVCASCVVLGRAAAAAGCGRSEQLACMGVSVKVRVGDVADTVIATPPPSSLVSVLRSKPPACPRTPPPVPATAPLASTRTGIG
eukprot:2063879-Rhodomonas_salina.2